MDSTKREGTTRLPRGWFATLVGGVLGALVVGFLGLMIAVDAADTYYPGGMEGLFLVAIGVLGGGGVGAALGAGLMLRAFRHERPFVTGFAFAVIEAIILVGLYIVFWTVLRQPLDSSGVLTGLFALSPVVAAIVARAGVAGGRWSTEET